MVNVEWRHEAFSPGSNVKLNPGTPFADDFAGYRVTWCLDYDHRS